MKAPGRNWRIRILGLAAGVLFLRARGEGNLFDHSGIMIPAGNKWSSTKQWKDQTKHKSCCQFYFSLFEAGPRRAGEKAPGSLKS